jgi:phage major head subunit gpT-like protein
MFDLESNMRVITSTDYQRLSDQLWWQQVCKTATSQSKSERLIWLLDTARIQKTGRGGGNLEFEDIVSQTWEYQHDHASAGLKITKDQFEDIDGRGIDYAAHWSRQMGAYSAYWPQKMLAAAIKANPIGYDGLTYFNTAHPLNPYNTGAGTYANVFTGSASGAYPGALKIDESVAIDAAMLALQKIIAYAATIKMANGEDPRMLVLDKLLIPPALVSRAYQLTNAKFIAQAAGSGAASADIEAVIRAFGLGQPVVCPELGAAFGGSDTDFYVCMREITSADLGAWLYTVREPFTIQYYGPQTDAQLGRIREFQWMTEGRNSITPGHPFMMFKVKGTRSCPLRRI